MVAWNLINSVAEMGILTHYNNNLNYDSISVSFIGRRFLPYNGHRRGHLCHIDTFQVFSAFIVRIEEDSSQEKHIQSQALCSHS